jgi:hypothetical protein
LVDKQSPTLGTTVDHRRVEGLPLNGRNVLNLSLLQPGVTETNTGFGEAREFASTDSEASRTTSP